MSNAAGRRWRLALAQMRVEPGRPGENLIRAERWISAAAAQGAQAVLLPEALDCGWTHPSATAMAGPIPGGEACERLRAAAQAHRMLVCAGLVERAGNRLFNAAILVSPEGRLLLHHRKIHELDFASRLYATGDRLGVAETELGRIGMMICADAFVPGQTISRVLGRMGAGIILSPCAWAVPPDHDQRQTPYGQLWLENYQPVAREFGTWIAGCSNVGPVIAGEWTGWRCIGCSLVVDGGGEVAARGSYGEDAEECMIVEVCEGSVGGPGSA